MWEVLVTEKSITNSKTQKPPVNPRGEGCKIILDILENNNKKYLKIFQFLSQQTAL